MIFPDVTGVGAHRFCFHKLLARSLAALLAFTAVAADDPRPPEERFAGDIGTARNNIEWRQNELKWLVNELENLGDFGKADLVLVRQDFARAVDAWQKVSETYRRGDGDRAKEMQREAEALQPSTTWRPRVEARKRQADLWPADDWVTQLTARWRGRLQRLWAPRFIEARRRASTAWARAAESVTPEADPQKVVDAEEAAWLAEFEARAAEAVFNSNEDKDRVMHNSKVTSAELDRRLAEIETLDKERLELARVQAETDRKRRDWERRRKLANKSLATAYESAAKAWEAEQAEQRKRKR
jgi:hypothetical protein